MLVGVISDTHGLLRPEAVAQLTGSDLIIHAGDVGRPGILDDLAALAPTHTVRGNIDTEFWAEALPERRTVEVAGHRLLVLHDISALSIDPATDGFSAVIFGHSHRPSMEDRDGVLFLNPGSAGPRRFRLPVTMARIRVNGRAIAVEIVTLL